MEAIRIENLTKRYKEVVAVVDASISCKEAAILAQLQTILQELREIITAIVTLATATNDVVQVVGILRVGTNLQTICAAEGVVLLEAEVCT